MISLRIPIILCPIYKTHYDPYINLQQQHYPTALEASAYYEVEQQHYLTTLEAPAYDKVEQHYLTALEAPAYGEIWEVGCTQT